VLFDFAMVSGKCGCAEAMKDRKKNIIDMLALQMVTTLVC
jgi:hypothetical protein